MKKFKEFRAALMESGYKDEVYAALNEIGLVDATAPGMEYYERKFGGKASPQDVHAAMLKGGYQPVTRTLRGDPIPPGRFYAKGDWAKATVALLKSGNYYIFIDYRKSHD